MSMKLQKVAQAYFDALKSHDFQGLRALMVDNICFVGPLARCHSAEECMMGLKGLSSITTDIVIQRMWVDGIDVITWFELYTTKTTEPLSVCNWMQFEGDKISRIKVTFDPRTLLAT